MPESIAGGRYQVRRFLGEGAKKRVYLAFDTRLDREVAVALIKADGLDGARIGVPRAFYYDSLTLPGESDSRGGLSPERASVMAEAITPDSLRLAKRCHI